MRIQTRLFLGTGLLVLALVAAQWWLQRRQLEAVGEGLGAVAEAVGRDLLATGPRMAIPGNGTEPGQEKIVWVDSGDESGEIRMERILEHDVRVQVVPEDGGDGTGTGPPVADRTTRISPDHPAGPGESEIRLEAHRIELEPDSGVEIVDQLLDAEGDRRFVFKVAAEGVGAHRVLIIGSDQGVLRRIPIPVEPAVRSLEATLRQGAVVSVVLLAFGLVGAALLSNRVARPLRGLADGAEAVGRGELGIQVPVTDGGEIGELQRSFNAMSVRLAELETERDRWRQREHLAQLGDVSRGLAHTLRNPLNTLGLAVDELAAGGAGGDDLVATARAQIRRIDRWLRSFLALGAEDAAEPATEDLADLARAAVLEAVQQGRDVRLVEGGEPVPVRAVASALRAALANLLDNAIEASPPDEPVELEVERRGRSGIVTVRDRGPGLPEEVRRRLFEPHVTTRVGGSGMGLFLARQLVVGMHGGELDVADREGGGTIAVVQLPIAHAEDGDDA
ncbi:MAG: HAMP domain-containing histidine kinase [Thermoanaerobaculales bacterium]|jgi:signal transduction histidine kinase|nr:HAMP domain-containing histidine kinase [Thermoanaerobaculales bacterium]